MLQILSFVAQSDIHGLGVFANQDIKKGQIIWRFEPPFDRTFSKIEFLAHLERLPSRSQLHIVKMTYLRENKIYLLQDHSTYINHSEYTPNVELIDTQTEVAVRDIGRGEELLENYSVNYDKDDLFQIDPLIDNSNGSLIPEIKNHWGL